MKPVQFRRVAGVAALVMGTLALLIVLHHLGKHCRDTRLTPAERWFQLSGALYETYIDNPVQVALALAVGVTMGGCWFAARKWA